MKRNWDAIRMILTKVEAQPCPVFELYPQDFAPLDEQTAGYQLRLLLQAHMIEGERLDLIGGVNAVTVTGLTWQGHELLDAVRSPKIWEKIRELAVKRGLDLSFEAISIIGRMVLETLAKGQWHA